VRPTVRELSPTSRSHACLHRVKSVTAGGAHRAEDLTREHLPALLEAHPIKYLWFLQQGYRPHIWQSLFHSARTGDVLKRFRHLVAGRRGGKTLSAAWEVLFYALHPAEFHRDAHGVDSQRPLWIWALAKDYKVGRPALLTLIEVIRQTGLVKDKDYRYNKTEKVFEFYGPGEELLSTVEFRSADDPQSLRGAGLDILWIDESAFIPNRDAWDVVYPALADREGLTITTTTPNGKNWFYESFFTADAVQDEHQFAVEYTSIDNPYFPRAQWAYALQWYHPVMFRQEFMAAFDAMAGVALQGDWLKFYVTGSPDIQTDDIGVPKTKDGRYNLRLFIGVDPAISLADDADNFAMSLIGLTYDNSQAYLLDYYVDKIQFPAQLDKIREWFLTYRPEMIGIESNAYQRALMQMTARIDGLPPVVAVISKSRKEERILGLGPLFKIGKVRINKKHARFIDQWVSFDPSKKNGDDDLLDAVEIALGVAGVLLPIAPMADLFDESVQGSSLEEEAYLQILRAKDKKRNFDPELGSEA
jgi:predicted phage terminase large subunit-like protein